MGMHARAVLFYGYCWEEPTDLFGEGDSDVWVDRIARDRGAVNPWDGFTAAPTSLSYERRRAQDEAWTAAHRKELDAWYEAGRAVEKEYGVEVCFHGVDGYSCPYLVVSGQRRTADAGEAVDLTAGGVNVDPAWDATFDRWFAAAGVEKPHPYPRWWLVASYG
jgi:hypothetical protein